MAWLADFNRDPPSQFGGHAKSRAKHAQDQRVAGANQFHAAAHADTQRLQTLRIFVVRLDAAHDGADLWGQFIKPHHVGGMVNNCHSNDKISFP